ncbi:MAG: crossover junction endodeoxyribonuclease RuvC [Peptococcaceae bacterium]|nr:crossover junction endodeoxyribonuclease RuvC [Peptococcaceae bacterium]
MIIIGLDPGIAITGYGVLSLEGTSYHVKTFDCINTSSKLPLTLRLQKIYHELCNLFEQWQPAELAVEQLFFNKNVKTALMVGQARGVSLLAAAQAGVQVFEYTPLQVKQSVTGSGRADKQQVQYMVRAVLGLPEVPKPDDVADALGVAICHCHMRGGG